MKLTPFFKKIENFIPIFASFPTWFQIIIVTWFIITVVVLLAGLVLYYNEKRYVIKIMPDTVNTIIPYLDDDKNKKMIIGLNIWPKGNLSFELCLINVDIFSEDEQKYLNYGIKITDNMNRNLNFPIILQGNQKENILFHLPIFNQSNSLIKAKINFVPYDIRNKLTAKITISRGLDNYQVSIIFGRSHYEFGSFKVKGEGSRNIKFLEKFKGGPPEISTDFKPDK